MKTTNLISAYQGATALESLQNAVDKKFKKLKPHEIRNLKSFCDIMRIYKCEAEDFDGFFVGYSIKQIGKEFDLLRFGDDFILNLEIKSELKIAKKKEKILKQLRVNYYYLKFLSRPLKLLTYVENDGFYEYDILTDTLIEISESKVASYMREQVVNYSIDLDKVFLPSNYLVSPFNSTDKFIEGEYFLTTAQQIIKDEVFLELVQTPFMYVTVSANAGTGKSLMMYDIAKELIRKKQNPIIIHCGILNNGHEKLIETYNWEIHSIKTISKLTIDNVFDDCSVLFIDEAQRIRESQLKLIIQKSIELQIPIIFSYDVKQYLKEGENRDIEVYLKENYPQIPLFSKKLTTKIRTNKELASFITNLLNIGSSIDHLDYYSVSIEYFDNTDDLKNYLDFLDKNDWTTITYTTSQYNRDPYDFLAQFGEKNAHEVIGQEFSKVVFIMDDNFRYEGNKLTARNGYYSAKGMLYQIVTRVVDNLKIIVLKNPALYKRLLEIKALGE